mmetsp:Transcript_3729/g.7118  ORF Transcript_3729/g.7118 Transcript_3729/m.7118 type:complete len:114 (+) Transcript_3729:125-466(+)
MTNWMTQSTIARFHEERHARRAASPMAEQREENVVPAHPHATTLSSFSTDSTIYRLHEDRHHGVIHATSPAMTNAATECHHWPSWQDFCTKSSIQRFHERRHEALGISPIHHV